MGQTNEELTVAKPLSFKDFIVVDYTPGMGEQISYNAQKRHRGVVGENANEALSHQQRIKASLRMRKMKQRIKLGRARALRKSPDMSVIKKRALRQARLIVLKKLTKGLTKDELSFSRRTDIEKRLEKKKGVIQRIAKKMIPVVRKQDRDRRSGAGKEK